MPFGSCFSLITIPFPGGNFGGAGHIKQLLRKCWEQSSLRNSDSSCRPGGAAFIVSLNLLDPEGNKGYWWQLIHNIWLFHKLVQVPPQAFLFAVAAIRHSHSGEASKCSMEPLPQLITVAFHWNFGVAQYCTTPAVLEVWVLLCITGFILIQQMPTRIIFTPLELLKVRGRWSSETSSLYIVFIQ